MSRFTIQLLAIVIFALTLFFVWDFGQRVLTNVRLDQTEKQLELQVKQAEATKTALIAQKTRVASSEFAEAEARSKWRWVRDGETLVIPRITPAPTPVVVAPAPPPPPAKAWWQDWFDFLFGP